MLVRGTDTSRRHASILSTIERIHVGESTTSFAVMRPAQFGSTADSNGVADAIAFAFGLLRGAGEPHMTELCSGENAKWWSSPAPQPVLEEPPCGSLPSAVRPSR